MRVGLLGGTFDPIHKGHLKLGLAALKQLKLSRVYFVLSPRSPFKLGQPLAPVAHRLNMLHLAIRSKDRFMVGSWELKRPGPSYTFRMVRHFKQRHPKDALFLIMGSDALKGFSKWKHSDQIRTWATLVVGQRPGAMMEKRQNQKDGSVIVLKGTFLAMSSTEIRKRMKSQQGDSSLMPPPVLAYIQKHQLYAR